MFPHQIPCYCVRRHTFPIPSQSFPPAIIVMLSQLLLPLVGLSLLAASATASMYSLHEHDSHEDDHHHRHLHQTADIVSTGIIAAPIPGRGCATLNPAPAVKAAVERAVAERLSFLSSPAGRPVFRAQAAAGPVNIKTYVHVLMAGPAVSQGNITAATITAQMKVLNTRYARHGIQFTLANVNRVYNPAWFNSDARSDEEIEYKTKLRTGKAADLNLYLLSPGQGILGWATFPFSVAEKPIMDGVCLLWSTMPGAPLAPYNLGMTAVHEVNCWSLIVAQHATLSIALAAFCCSGRSMAPHLQAAHESAGLYHFDHMVPSKTYMNAFLACIHQCIACWCVAFSSHPKPASRTLLTSFSWLYPQVGHWLGLYHTFQDGCSEPGDYVSDTPQEEAPTFGCPTNKATCNANVQDPISNYMDYSDDACMNRFTNGQTSRMQTMWHMYRQGK